MSITVTQRHQETGSISPAAAETTVEQEWFAIDTTRVATLSDVYTTARATIPNTYLGLYLQLIAPTEKGAGFWEIHVRYGARVILEAGQFKFTGKTSGKEVHREVSLENIHWYSDAGVDTAEVPDFGGLIGVEKDKITGVDVVGPGFSFTITKKFAATAIATDFLDQIVDLKPSVNDGTLVLLWKGQTFTFSRGELLLHDATFNDAGKDLDGTELIEVVYDFVCERNVTGLTVGSITGIAKEGHHYLWYFAKNEPSNDWLSATILGVYVERVYEYSNFSALGL